MTAQPDLEAVLRAALAEHGVAGAVLACARPGRDVTTLALGADAAGVPLTADTFFPVTSITKLATALAVLRLVAAGSLDLDDAVERHLPGAAAADHGITLRRLLSHTSGLPFDLPAGAAPYAPGLDWPALGRACLATPPRWAPRTRVVYSNVGVGLLALLVERVTAAPFATALAEQVLAPLGIVGYLGAEPPRVPARIQGTGGGQAGAPLEPINSRFWRALALPWGGLVTDAAGALALVRAFAGQPAGFLPDTVVAEATHDQAAGLGGGMYGLPQYERCPWGLGVELRGDKTPHYTSPQTAPNSFGHVGGSGCIAWADPATGVAWALLSTQVLYRWWQAWPAIGAAVLAE